MIIKLSSEFARNIKPKSLQDAVRKTVKALAQSAAEISHICARGPLEGALGATTGEENSDGDQQKTLDVRSDEIVTAALKTAPVAYYASEEQDDIITLDKDMPLAVASDPLDGSSNIDTNVSIGTIFSIFPVAESAQASFFRSGAEQICGGFFVYGPQTSLVITTGAGVDTYVLNPDTGVFELAITKMDIAKDSTEFAINASNLRHWDGPICTYIEDCLAGVDGPLGRKHNMRWVGSLVADAGRILTRGGVFLYPSDDRPGYEHGRLRLLYEANPIAFVIEQAGGVATDGGVRILDLTLEELHQRVPLIFGSEKSVQMVARYHHQRSQKTAKPTLFNNRGLPR
ncbi:MAG: class 1 fructose-bisphosphatase [Robiginitomaculum sp.]